MKKDKESFMLFIWDKFNKELEIWVLNVLRIVSLIVSDIFLMIGEKKYMNIFYIVVFGFYGCSMELLGFYYIIVFVFVYGGCILRVFMFLN